MRIGAIFIDEWKSFRLKSKSRSTRVAASRMTPGLTSSGEVAPLAQNLSVKALTPLIDADDSPCPRLLPVAPYIGAFGQRFDFGVERVETRSASSLSSSSRSRSLSASRSALASALACFDGNGWALPFASPNPSKLTAAGSGAISAPEGRVPATNPDLRSPGRRASVGAMNETEYAPGDPAPFSGIYELLNVLGLPSKTRIPRRQGERLPPAPLGWTWRFVDTETNRPFPTGGEFAVC